MEKITSLTKEQEEQIPFFIQKWVKKSYEDNNKDLSIELVRKVYKDFLKIDDVKVLYFTSPILCHIANLIIKGNNQIYNQLGSQLDNQLDSQLGNQLYMFWRIAWLGWEDYVNYIGGDIQINETLSSFIENVHFIIPYENVCFVSAKPKKVCFKGGILHSDTQKVVEYEDGWGWYALNRVTFPENLWKKVVSGNMPFEDVLKIEDIDQRTQAMRYSDVRKFLKHSKAKLLNKSTKGNELYKIPKGDIFTENAYYLLYKCPSTGKEYISGVPKGEGIKGSADEAMGWKFGLTMQEYQTIEDEG